MTRDRAAAVCEYGGGAGGVGDEYCYGGRVFEPAGVVVDSFRFTDSFQTLEMNASEHERL